MSVGQLKNKKKGPYFYRLNLSKIRYIISIVKIFNIYLLTFGQFFQGKVVARK